MSLAEQLYEEACEFLTKANAVDTNLLESKELELHKEYIAYYQTIKNEIEAAGQSKNTDTPEQVAKRFIAQGMSTELIMRATGLSWLVVEGLRPKKK